MKIIKKNLKFDMVLDGEKINSLEELREHPSTELLDLQQDGRLSRWVRAHGGAGEADQLCFLSLTGEKTQDLYAICQILNIDIELEDIIDAFKYEELHQHNEKNIDQEDTHVGFPFRFGCDTTLFHLLNESSGAPQNEREVTPRSCPGAPGQDSGETKR